MEEWLMKRIWPYAAVLCALAALALIGFSHKSEKQSPSSPAVGTSSQSLEPADLDRRGLSGKHLSVLAIVPETGPGAAIGDFVKNGILLYQSRNATSRLEIHIEDSESSPEKAVGILQESIAMRKPDVVISVLSAVTGAVVAKAAEANVFVVGVNVSSEKVLCGQPNAQRINDRARDITEPLATLARQHWKRAGLLCANDEFGSACRASFLSTFAQGRTPDVIAEDYNPRDSEMRTIVQKVLSGRPECLFVAGYGPAYEAIFKTIRELEYPGQVLAEVNFSNPYVLEHLGDAADGVVFSGMEICLSEPRDAKAAEFVDLYRTRFGTAPWLGAAYVFDALSLLEAMAANGETPSHEAFEAFGTWHGIAGDLALLDGGECQYSFELLSRSQGRSLPYIN
jgi:branched-chain amino acid transport system substrate-binding protein